MPCTKCNSDFNMFNWKLKCAECEDNHCGRCLKKIDGCFYCDICSILITRPPDKEKLMKLKVKDLTNYLTRKHVSVHGLVEKQELVELFFKNGTPGSFKKTGKKFPKNLGGSVPNLSHVQAGLNNLRSNAEAAFQNLGSFGQSRTNTNNNTAGPSSSPFSSSNRTYHTTPSVARDSNARVQSSSTSSTNLNNFNTIQENVTDSANKLPKRMKITDFKSLDELSILSSKELKELLLLNRVDYKGCVEKIELLEKVNILWIDANITTTDEDHEDAGGIENCCKICMDAPLDCVLLECGHIATCINCGKQLNECPICRQYVIRVVRTFKA